MKRKPIKIAPLEAEESAAMSSEKALKKKDKLSADPQKKSAKSSE